MKPYTDEYLNENEWVRTFDPSVTENEEYVWHRDKCDRAIEVLEGNDWQFQFDDELPVDINKDTTLFVPKMKYHRIIPGTDRLKIKIKES